MIEIDYTFDNCNSNMGYVFQINSPMFKDDRGYFSEVLKTTNAVPEELVWFSDFSWIKQINRSSSIPNVIRGLHAQSGSMCQAKLVEVIQSVVYDIIIDARPDSRTFGVSKFYELNGEIQNKLFVPRGFLHGFIVPDNQSHNAIFNYYCDNVFNKESEVNVSPESIIPDLIENLNTLSLNQFQDIKKLNNIIYSEKDRNGESYCDFIVSVKNKFDTNGELWYK